ncbi:IclR family transcriptional regulator [Sphingomonas sp. Leaf67]|uniref:IclR family transcriptional regulator n=1 Tax=Sphingomonas sp. Leaf67 TaxID=1736230 RepID=UPI0039E1E0BB
MRGLDVIEAVAAGAVTLPQLSNTLKLTRSTAHRLASSLVERGYLGFTPRTGYRLGRKLLKLGNLAQEETDIIQFARPHLEELAQTTEDAVHLGVLDGDFALYLDKMPGKRRITICSRVGDRHPLTSTGLGKALMLDHPPAYWEQRFAAESSDRQPHVDPTVWRERMERYVTAGCTFDLEENEDQIRCVAAPIRDARGQIVAAISVSSAAIYMGDARLEDLSTYVTATADGISRDLDHPIKAKER